MDQLYLDEDGAERLPDTLKEHGMIVVSAIGVTKVLMTRFNTLQPNG